MCQLFDRRMTTKLINDNTEAFYRISQLYFSLGEEEDSLRYVYGIFLVVYSLYSCLHCSTLACTVVLLLLQVCGQDCGHDCVDPLPV